MARTFPGISSSQDENEWDRVLREVKRVAPGLLNEITPPREKMIALLKMEGITGPGLAAFKANGPILSAHMQAFAAKVGFALRYEDVGYPVPAAGGVQVRWFTSGELWKGRLPEEVYETVGPFNLMRQGKITSEGMFEYGWGDFQTHEAVRLYYAKVREAFAVVAFVSDDRERLPFPLGSLATFAPGDLVEPLYDRLDDAV